jgi:hypothetical protein
METEWKYCPTLEAGFGQIATSGIENFKLE